MAPESTQSTPLELMFSKDRKVLTVSELTKRIKSCLERNLGYIWVSGEVTDLRIPTSGHHYFSLKDESAQIRCVLWASTAQYLEFKLQDGLEIIVFGRVSVYEKAGEYQIIVDKVEPKGLGARQLALAQLKERLAKEGLFDPAHKRPLPLLPQSIGIITSPTGAALRDILNIIDRRFPDIHILIHPVKVQGEEAPAEIVQAFQEMNRLADGWSLDVLILARGGGSAEDLSAFNTEVVARAIYASDIPVISAVGHEIDLTISDLVADRRAATPSEAAELVVPVKTELVNHLGRLERKLIETIEERIKDLRQRLDALRDSYALCHPAERLRQYQQRLDETFPRLMKTIRHLSQLAKGKVQELAGQLEAFSPLKVLQRGYSITRDSQTKKILTSIKQVKLHQEILTRLAQGELISQVTNIIPTQE